MRPSIHSAPLRGFLLDFVSRKRAKQISKAAKKKQNQADDVDFNVSLKDNR